MRTRKGIGASSGPFGRRSSALHASVLLDKPLFSTMTRSRARSAALALFALLVLGSSLDARAQDAPNADESQGPSKRGYVAVGVNVADLDPLNDRLSATGYPTVSTELFSVGAGGYRVVANRLLFGAEMNGLFVPRQAARGRDVFVGGGYGLVTLGYLTRPTPRLRLYPQAGVGGGGLVLDIGDDGTDSFDDVLADPDRSATLSTGSLLVSLGFGLEYQFGAPTEKGVRLGLRGGYLLSALSSDWSLDRDRVGGGPDASLQGPFLRLTVGGLGNALKSMDSDD